MFLSVFQFQKIKKQWILLLSWTFSQYVRQKNRQSHKHKKVDQSLIQSVSMKRIRVRLLCSHMSKRTDL